jgi:hypothetical protein
VLFNWPLCVVLQQNACFCPLVCSYIPVYKRTPNSWCCFKRTICWLNIAKPRLCLILHLTLYQSHPVLRRVMKHFGKCKKCLENNAFMFVSRSPISTIPRDKHITNMLVSLPNTSTSMQQNLKVKIQSKTTKQPHAVQRVPD